MTIAFGQLKSAHAAAGVSTVTTGNAPTNASGSGFVIVCQNQGGALSVSDSKGNSYTPIGTQVSYNFTNRGAAIFYCPLGVGGAAHTATASGGGGQDMSVYFVEITTTSGLGIVLDQNSVANSSTLSTTAITTLFANEAIIAAFCGASTSNPATHTIAGGSFALNGNINITDGASTLDSTGCIAREIVSSIQSGLQATFTEVGNSGGTMAMFAASFYEAGVTVAWLT